MNRKKHTYRKPVLYCCGFLLSLFADPAYAKIPPLPDGAGTEQSGLLDMNLYQDLLRLRIRLGEDFLFPQSIPDASGYSDAESPEGLRPKVLLPLSARRILPGCPLPAQEKTIEALERQISRMTESYSGIWSVYVKNLTTGEAFTLQDIPMKSASVMKLFILSTVYSAIESQELERTSEITELMTSMICDSSNEASNRLLAILGDGSYEEGIAKVNSYISRSGYSSSTHEYNGFNDSATVLDSDHFNQVSARDCGELLERVYRRELFSRSVCNEIEELMLNQHTRYKIPADLPEGVQAGNKTGEMDTVENDVAIVYGTYSDYILCVLSSDWNSKDEAITHIQEISSVVYDFFDDPSYYQDTASDSFALLARIYMEHMEEQAAADDSEIPEYIVVSGNQYVLVPDEEAAYDAGGEVPVSSDEELKTDPSADRGLYPELEQAFPILNMPQS